MTRRPKRDDGAAINLFPFLAVLICTVGALIVLLVVVMQKAHATGDDAAPSPPIEAAQMPQSADAGLATPDISVAQSGPSTNGDERWEEIVAQADLEREKYLWQVETLRESRERTISRLQDKRKEVGHLEDHIRRLQTKLEELEAAAKIELGEPSQDLEKGKAKLAEIVADIKDLETQISTQREKLARQSKNYMVVPYAGANGTNRRPFYIECRAESIVVQPIGIELREEDFAPPAGLGPNNPLAAAVRATREFILQMEGAEAAEPYPLMIVRPSGAATFRVCQQALRDWKHDMGYELIASDKSLKYPIVDPELERRIIDTITRTRKRQTQLKQFIATMGEDEFGPALRASGQAGGFVHRDGRPAGVGTRKQRIRNNSPQVNRDMPPAGGPQQRLAQSRRHQTDQRTEFPPGMPLPATVPDDTKLRRSTQTAESNQDFESDEFPIAHARDASAEQASAGQTRGADAPADAHGGVFFPTGETAGETGSATETPPTSSTDNIAQSRGKNWALPHATGGAIGITRPLSLTFVADRMLLKPEGGSAASPQAFALSEGLREATLQLVSNIWKRIDDWGSAGPGVYWKPKLEITVAADAEQNFEVFQALLQGSGLEIQRR